ncbi:ABC-type dipeptide/oligopeptide/nickel transport system permease component [Kaistia hirudinis]|uniref:ABC-type dipeptide/oligopeptide/nickel transport system permease component n=1 Tax=Kaistia hirudinis TaxID=1293440 RepID=A0A840AT33_9HYPH|nr:ABC transporter permease [Kaistia hirudinis]MBB3933419.1 ABC-type dipeptide/oligopeptide/nickel transport system permease component [Kaistia hirudinis]
MQSFVLGRVLQAAFIIFFIAVSVFLILRLSAGDPARIRAPVFARPDVIEQYRKDFGTDRPVIAQLGSFFAGVAKGDLGNSFRFQEPVIDLIARALPKTLLLAATALAISLTLAIVLGSMAALRPNSFWGWLSSALAAFGQAAPVFWFGVVLVLIFSITLKWFPSGGFSGPLSLVLPAIAVSLSILPTQLRVLRAAMEATLRQDFIRTAHAFGLRERRIVFVYALRNACLPLITVTGVDIGYLLGGVIVAEVVFNFPGIGELALVALNARDYPLIQGITIVTATTFVLVNLLIDLLYGWIDPRIRLEQP